MKLVNSWLEEFRETLSSFRGRMDRPGDISVPAMSGVRASRTRSLVIAARVAWFLSFIEPIWATAAMAFVYLSVLNIVVGHSWLGLVAMALPFMGRRVSYGYVSRRTPFDIPIAILLLAGLVGIGVSADKGLSWSAYQTLMACVLFYYSLANYHRPRLLVKCGLAFAVVLVLTLGGYVFLQFPTSLPVFSQLQGRLHINPPSLPSGWINPPLAASASGATVAVEVVAMIVAGVALFPGKRVVRIGTGIVALLLLGVLVISLSRATWMVVAVGMMVLLVWRSRWFLLSLPGWLGLMYWSITSRIGMSWGGGVDLVKELIQLRWHVWEGFLRMIAAHPVAGVGLGGYLRSFPEYNIAEVVEKTAHNAYLQFYSDFGLLGLVALVIAFAIFLKLGFQIGRAPSGHPWRGVAVGAWAAILVGAIYGLIESAPTCILAVGKDGHYFYAISPLFAILSVALVVAHRSLVSQELSSGGGARHSDEV